MNRVLFLAAALVATVTPALAQTQLPGRLPLTPEPKPLNVVVVVMDDVGHDLVGAYAERYACPGCQNVPQPCTPNLDAMAKEGALFTNAWSAPLCSPTRAQILTGRRSSQSGIGTVTWPHKATVGLNPNLPNIAKLLPLDCAVGKWHLADNSMSSRHPLDSGFSVFDGTMWNLSSPPGDGPKFDDWRKYDGLAAPVQQTGYATTTTFDDAILHLNELETQNDPWFLYVATHTAHVPMHCPDYPQGSFPCTTDWWNACRGFCTYSQNTCQAQAMVQALDYELGRFLEVVDWSNTAVVVVGDNGTDAQAKNPPFVNGAKNTLYQGGVNVPLIVRGPGFVRGDVHELVHVTDLFATVADLAGATIPPNTKHLDSVSIAPLLNPAYDTSAQPRQYVYSERFKPNFNPKNGGPPPGYLANFQDRTIRNAKYKIIEHRFFTGITYEFFELYDPTPGAPPVPQDPAIGPDPHELIDLMPFSSSWTPEQQAGFFELVNELTTNYPPLPVWGLWI
jgi:arylsulfatase A-like enzyme